MCVLVESCACNVMAHSTQAIVKEIGLLFIDSHLYFLSKSNLGERLEDDAQVQFPRLVFHVIQVQFQSSQHLLHRVGIAIIECGIRRDAWAHLIEFHIARVMLHNLVDEVFAFWAIANKRHVAYQHVPQLWQLVQVM